MATTFVSVNGYRNDMGKTTGLRKVIHGLLTTDGNDGASAGDIPASTFGLSVIEEISPATKSDNTLIVVLAPAYSSVFQCASVIGKAAATAAPADIPSGTYAVTVKGY